MTFYVFNHLVRTLVAGRKCEWNLCCEWSVIPFLSVVSEICAWCTINHLVRTLVAGRKWETVIFLPFLAVEFFFHFHSIIAFCAAAYVSAIWRIYSSKELQRSVWEFWFRGSANNNWIDHFPGMLWTYFQQAFIIFLLEIFGASYQMLANKTNLFEMDLIVGTFHLN
jgi:hypothetical protein